MNAGLPTTGIGGIFYFLCVVIMFLAEIVNTLKGKSSFARWKFVGGQMTMLFLMLGMIFLTGKFFSRLIPASAKQMVITGLSSESLSSGTGALFLTPFIILVGLLLLTQAFRLYLVFSKTRKA